MGAWTYIEWAHHTFNLWWGCEKVAPECTHCYAETLDHRFGGAHWGPGSSRKMNGERVWRQPGLWNKLAEEAGVRFRVFCMSMGDLFEDRPELVAPRARLEELIDATPNLDWLLLTKRPENFGFITPKFNTWFGVSAGTQKTWDRNLPLLLEQWAPVRFVSVEPLLEPIDMGPHTPDWVIVGGESGPKARPMAPRWVRRFRDECMTRGVSFFFKQWGEHNDELVRIGKKEAGRKLDGVIYSGLPYARSGEV